MDKCTKLTKQRDTVRHSELIFFSLFLLLKPVAWPEKPFGSLAAVQLTDFSGSLLAMGSCVATSSDTKHRCSFMSQNNSRSALRAKW
jgi:hypothetical protein